MNRDDAAIARNAGRTPSCFVLAGRGLPCVPLLRTAERAGGLGLLAVVADRLQDDLDAIASAGIAKFGLYAESAAAQQAILGLPDCPAHLVLLSEEAFPANPDELAALRSCGAQIWAEFTGEAPDAVAGHVDGIVLKGHECGGLVSELTAFVLAQKACRDGSLPFVLRGGITPETAAAATVAGAQGVMLDDQIALFPEFGLKDHARRKQLTRLSGSETVQVELGKGRYFRALAFSKTFDAAALKNALDSPSGRDETLETLSWKGGGLAPGGQGAALAAGLLERHGTLARFLAAIRNAQTRLPALAREQAILSEHSAFAESMGVRFPVLQGPMTRVSDVPEFFDLVAREGALPFAALALLKGTASQQLLAETKALLKDKPWGVGLLGFAAPEILKPQLEAVAAAKPDFAIVAGGRVNQLLALEEQGIRSFVHVTTVPLLQHYLDEGIRRFVIEGRECGGHIGPLSSFVLWSAMTDALRSHEAVRNQGSSISVVFAGGIHDALSAAMVTTLAAPLAELGVQVGVLMGTAYLFTREIVEAGAVLSDYQQVALACDGTEALWEGPGFASRCAVTPITQEFQSRKSALEDEGKSVPEIREALETYTLGRLRMATKGVARSGADNKLTKIGKKQRQIEGMYMIGQVAALQDRVQTIADLHQDVTSGAQQVLKRVAATAPRAKAVDPAPCDIAIVGMSTLLPGSDTLDRYWRRILTGESAIQQVPSDRWSLIGYHDDDPRARDKIYATRGGFLDDVAFDPLAYGIPPSSLKSVDPMQLLALEVVADALKDGDLEAMSKDARMRTSVMFGFSGGLGEHGSQYAARSELLRLFGDVPEEVLSRLPEWTEDSFAGLLPNVATGRVANRFDFGGTNQTVDAACASSLAALYAGVMELEAGRSDMVIAGGVDTLQSPFGYLCFAKTTALSPRGVCGTFDQSADGIAISEGLAAVVLKRLDDAERDGDRIYAVIKGVGASSDGRAKGLTAPLPQGQKRALNRAYGQAGFAPSEVQLFEAHGTGTVAGDRAELETVGGLLADQDALAQSAVIGSVKTVVGHTKATAGLAGLIKIAKGLHHRVIPPHSGVTVPNAAFDEPDAALCLVQQPQPWVARPGKPRRAGVSAFGFGGTNFHVAVEEYADPAQPPARQDVGETVLFCALAADDDAGLIASLQKIERDLVAGNSANSALQAAASTAGSCRLAFAAQTVEEVRDLAAQAIEALQTGAALPKKVSFSRTPRLLNGGKLAYLFSGQGAQYPNMLRQTAMLSPAFLARLDQAEAVFAETKTAERVGRGLSQLVFPPDAFLPEIKKRQMAALTATEVAQPALGAVEFGLFETLSGFDLAPDMAAGHSYGEFVALAASRALSFQELIRLSEARGRAIVDNVDPDVPGAMSAVMASAQVTRDALKGIDGVVIANINSPGQTVIAGALDAVDQADAALSSAGLTVVRVPVSQAFHSPLLKDAKAQFGKALKAADWSEMRLPVYSNTLAKPHDPKVLQKTLANHLVSPVDFVGMIEAMARDGADVFVEIGPKSILSQRVPEILGSEAAVSIALDRQGADALGLFSGLAQLFVEGAEMSLDVVFDALCDAPAARPVPDSKTTWLLNGAYARPVGAPRRDPAPGSINMTTHSGAASLPTPQTDQEKGITFVDMKPEALFASPTTRGGSGDPLGDYHAMMTEFLRVQENVMLAYLNQNGGAAPRAALPAQPAAAPLLQSAPSPVSAPIAPVPVAEVAPAPVVEPVPAAPAPTVVTTETVLASFIEIVADRTGYPTDALDPDQALEADLGVDSIKRMEVLGELQKTLPDDRAGVMRADMDAIVKLPSMREIVDHIFAGVSDQPAEEKGTADPFDFAGEAMTTATAVLPRYVQRPFEEPAANVPSDLEPDATFVLVGWHGALKDCLIQQCEEAGFVAEELPQELWSDGAVDALQSWLDEVGDPGAPIVILYDNTAEPPSPFSGSLENWRRNHDETTKRVFGLLQAAQPRLQAGGRFLSVSRSGGHFARFGQSGGPAMPSGPGIMGLVKALSLEWPAAMLKAVDLDPAAPLPAQVGHLWREITMRAGRREVGYPGGNRTIFRTEPASLAPPLDGKPWPEQDWVIVASGGARGITAECLRSLAPFGCHLVLLGRSQLPEAETDATSALDQVGLRQYYLARAKEAGAPVRPAEIEHQVQRHLNNRDQRQCMADLTELGGRVHYYSADVTDAEAVSDVADRIFEQFGRVDMIVHGAGIIEDCAFEKKTRESFDRVFDTKVDSAFLLTQALGNENLKSVCFFSSVAGRYGNPGQADYAAANETMNFFAATLRHELGPDVRVKAINWGPWGQTSTGAGMVTETVRAQFLRRGVGMVEAAPGRNFFFQEMFWSSSEEVEANGWVADGETLEAQATALPLTTTEQETRVSALLLSGARKDRALADTLEWRFDWVNAPYVDHHRFDGDGILPFAAAAQMMSELPGIFGQDRQIVAMENIRLLNGIKLDAQAVPLEFRLQETGKGNGLEASILSGDGKGRKHYSALLRTGPMGRSQPFKGEQGQRWDGPNVAEIYASWLSHGPLFQTLTDIDEIGHDFLTGSLTTSDPAAFAPHAPKLPWQFDVGLVDGALQLFWIWSWRHGKGAALPLGLDRIERFTESLAPGTPCRFVTSGMTISESGVVSGDVDIVDPAGNLYLRLTNLRMQSSLAIARLAGGWAGGRPQLQRELKVAE